MTLNRKLIDNLSKFQVSQFYFTVASVLIMLLSYIFNFGWFRIALTFPAFFYVYFFMYSNYNYNIYQSIASRVSKIVNLLSYITFVLAVIVLPDGILEEDDAAIFRLISNHSIINVLYFCFIVLIFTNFLLLVIQNCLILRLKLISEGQSDKKIMKKKMYLHFLTYVLGVVALFIIIFTCFYLLTIL